MKKSFQWVLLGNVLAVIFILLEGHFSGGPEQRTGFVDNFMDIFTLAGINMVLGIASAFASLVTEKCQSFIFPFLISGLVIFLVGFSLCTASFRINSPTTGMAAPASARLAAPAAHSCAVSAL